jgi:hypothetical protein
MAQVPSAVARAVDRLSRRAHRFHRFAHHPLCGEYRAELLQLGRRMRVCRGCLYAALGCSYGAITGALLAVTPLLVGAAAAALLGAISSPRSARASKLWTRWLPAAVLAFSCCAGVRVGGALGAAAAMCAAGAAAVLHAAYRRRGPDRSPCASCPERSQTRVCRGFAPIVQRERALQRVARRWLIAAGR